MLLLGKCSSSSVVASKAAYADVFNDEPIGRPDEVLVCWVEIIGPLNVSNLISLPKRKKASPSSIPPAPEEILVFDA